MASELLFRQQGQWNKHIVCIVYFLAGCCGIFKFSLSLTTEASMLTTEVASGTANAQRLTWFASSLLVDCGSSIGLLFIFYQVPMSPWCW